MHEARGGPDGDLRGGPDADGGLRGSCAHPHLGYSGNTPAAVAAGSGGGDGGGFCNAPGVSSRPANACLHRF